MHDAPGRATAACETLPAGAGARDTVINRFSPGEQGTLCLTKFFGIMGLFRNSRTYPRSKAGASNMTTVQDLS